MDYLSRADGTRLQRWAVHYLKGIIPGYADRKRRHSSEKRNKQLLSEIAGLYTQTKTLEESLSTSESLRTAAEKKNNFYEEALDTLNKDVKSQKNLSAHLKEELRLERRKVWEFLTASYSHLALVLDSSGKIAFANRAARDAAFNRGKPVQDYEIDLSKPRQDFVFSGNHYVCRTEELPLSDGYLVLFRRKGWLRKKPGTDDKIIRKMIEQAKKDAEQAQKALDQKVKQGTRI
jgi:hypothetical protein